MSNYQLPIDNDQLPEGYKQTEVGIIPEDWEIEKLTNLCLSIVDCAHSTPVWTSSGVVVLRNQNIRNGKLDLSEPSYTDELHFLARTRRATPVAGDLVITREAPMGEVCIIPSGLRCCLGQRMVLLRPNTEKCDSQYLLYELQSESIQQFIRVNGGTGSTVGNLRIPLIEAIPVPMSSPFEQRSIAQALSDVDRLIAALEKAIAKKRAIKTATMQQLLTGKKRLPGFGEGKGYQQTEVGVIPEDWIACSIQNLVEEGILEKPLDGNHGNIHPQSSDYVYFGIPFIMSNDIHNGKIDIQNCHFIKKEQADKLRKGFSVEDDVLLTHKGTVGNVAIVPKIPVEYLMLTPQVTYYRVKDASRLNNTFIKFYFECSNFQSRLEQLSGGGTRAYIGIVNQRQLPFILPSVEEQQAIATVLSDMDAEIAALETRLAKTQSIKQGMMQQLLTGKVRLLDEGIDN